MAGKEESRAGQGRGGGRRCIPLVAHGYNTFSPRDVQVNMYIHFTLGQHMQRHPRRDEADHEANNNKKQPAVKRTNSRCCFIFIMWLKAVMKENVLDYRNLRANLSTYTDYRTTSGYVRPMIRVDEVFLHL